MRRISVLLALSLIFLNVPVLAATVHPIWGPSTSGNSSSSPRSLPSGSVWQQSSSGESKEGILKERVCTRLYRRFADDSALLERVNERLQKRFGFTCTQDDATGGRPGTQLPSERVEGPAELRLARDAFNPVNDFVPRGASRVPMLRVVFSASCLQDVTMDDITVRDAGAGVPSDLSAVWMSVDGERVSRSRPLNRDKSVQLRFRRPFTIPACKSATIEFFAAVSPTALSYARHTLSIAAPEDIAGDAEVTGEFPITGERMSISASNTGKIEVSYLPIEFEPRVDGSDHEVIGRIRLSVDMVEDQTLHAIQFRNAGGTSEDGDVLGLFVRSTQGHARFTDVAPRLALDQMFVRFDPPLHLEKGETVDLDVVANIVTGTGTTLKVALEEPIDLYAVGSFYGYGRNGQLYGSEVTIIGEPKPLRIRGLSF